MFKSIQHRLYLCTALLVATVAAATMLLCTGHYFAALLSVVVIVNLLRQLKTSYDRYNTNIIFMLNALENGDYTYRFSERKLSVREREISKTLNRVREILENARTEVIQNENFLSLILEKVSTGIIIIDDGGIVHKVNRAALSMLGLSIFTHIRQLQPFDESLYNIFAALRAGDRRQLSLTTEREQTTLSLHVSQILLRRGMMRIVTLNNIGSELEMNEMESWIRLVRVMTHEIMNSIAPVTSISQTMSDRCRQRGADVAPSETSEAFDAIRTTAEGLLAFVNSYRKFTSIPVPQKTLFDLYALTSDLVRLYCPTAAEYGIELVLVAPQTSTDVVADEQQLRQALINLLKNALEADGCTRIVLSFHADGNSVVLDVANNGAPIAPEVLPHIFVPFFTTKADGSGIGLSVSRYILRLHGGKLQHCLSGDGLTTFRLTLPAADISSLPNGE
jgi:nitrogen fixation/metabolism regulation signal transduction histidine kinase